MKKNKRGQVVGKDKKIIIVNLYKSKLKKEDSVDTANPSEPSFTTICHEISEESGISPQKISSIIREYEVSKTVISPRRKRYRSDTFSNLDAWM